MYEKDMKVEKKFVFLIFLNEDDYEGNEWVVESN